MNKLIASVSLGFAFLALPLLASAATASVTIADNSFTPKEISVNAGDTIVWTNTGGMAHTVTADDGSFDAVVQPGQTFTRAFTAAGTNPYHCKFHGAAGGIGMAGHVSVAATTTAPTTFSASPASGPAPLTVHFQAAVATTTSLAPVIDFGDGQFGTTTDTHAPVCATCSPVYAIDHTYSATSTYTATLYALDPRSAGSAANNPLGQATIVVGGGNAPVVFIASPERGFAPLSVLFTSQATGTINAFGDEVDQSLVPQSLLPVNIDPTHPVTHTYTAAGTYTALFVAVIQNCPAGTTCEPLAEQATVTVQSDEEGGGGTTLACPNLTSLLKRGDTDASTGGQVSELQRFLTDYFNLPDDSLVVGTFGRQTERYVKKFQTQNGISPVGYVGKQTRAAILAACAGGGGGAFTFAATPDQGQAPLPVDFSYSDPNQGSAYNINFGDGGTGSLIYNVGSDCSAPGGCAPRYDAFHTYQLDGAYTAILTQVIDPCHGNTQCRAPVQVKQVATTSVMVSPVQTASTTFVATPMSGAVPLQVGFTATITNFLGGSYVVDFGDGSTTPLQLQIPVDSHCVSSDCPTTAWGTTHHTYSAPGTYTAALETVPITPGTVFNTDYFCIISTNPLVVTPVKAGTPFPSGCSNGSRQILNTVTITATDGTSASCTVLTHNLYLDQTDAETLGEVTKLQNFLIAQGDMAGPATGFFGPLTLQAVQGWQAANGIVSSGTPETTGYGYVGPKTRAAMAKGCTPPPPPQPPIPPLGSFSASPTSGTAPLSVTFNVPYLSADATLDFGDSATSTVAAASCTGACPQRTVVHAYSAAGTYTAQLWQATSSVVCTGITYDPNNPISILNPGANCANSMSKTVIGTVTITVSAATSPAALSAQCSADGASVTLSWMPGASAATYYPDLYMPAGNTCPEGWTNNWVVGGTMGCLYLGGTATLSITAAIPPGTSDAAEVYAASPATTDQTKWTKLATNFHFTCAAH